MQVKDLYLFLCIYCVVELDAHVVDLSFVRETNSSYFSQREALVQLDASTMLGYDITLSPDEEIVNNILMNYKNAEYSTALNTTNFPPANSFFLRKPEIDESMVFKFIQQMPKGSLLHAHDTASTSIDWVISNLTYWENLYMCNFTEDQILFSWFIYNTGNQDCDWHLVSDVRATHPTEQDFDDYLHEQLSLFTPHPEVKYRDIDSIWIYFERIFNAIESLLAYKESMKAYLYQGLTELVQDNITYSEFRGIISSMHELDGTILTEEETVGVYKNVVDDFVAQNPLFYNSKFIYAPNRMVTEEVVDKYVDLVIRLKDLYPDYVIGFDLVGQEDLGKPLIDFINPLLRLGEQDPPIPVYFHAGETDWEGISSDENLFDALMLNSTRIGHGYAIIKHPALMQEAISKDIPIEVCPLSNQILLLVDDLRNHPAAALAAQSFPLIVSSDDPSFWEAKPLSHDFYEAFMAMGGAHADLKFLKKLAINSIEYTGLDEVQKGELMAQWLKQWTNFISSQIADQDSPIGGIEEIYSTIAVEMIN